MAGKTNAPVSKILLCALTIVTVYAGEVGHYAPGVANIRDMAMPEPGYYLAVYNYSYRTSRINDAQGNQTSSVTIGGGGPGGGVTLNLNVDVSMYALAPTFIWVTKQKFLGAKYGIFLTPTFTNTSINGLLSAASGAGRSASAGQFNVGDVYVQPVWLGWTKPHADIAAAYGFYIPSGKYKIETVTLPGGGTARAEAANNTGYGFWTNQVQGSATLYPWKDRRMAVQNGLTWEIHRNKRSFDLTPGQNLTYNWGISQFLPLRKDQSLLAEIGPTGYNSFQVTSDSGADATNPDVHDRVHAVGIQAGLTMPKRGMVLNFHWFHEYAAVDRFQGSALGGTFAIKF